jgi:cystathionine beta-lyase
MSFDDTPYDFDTQIDRRGTNSTKWDELQNFAGVSPDTGLAMWVADMDFRAPEFLQDATRQVLDTANYGYFTGMKSFNDSVAWWMKTRHNWQIDTDWIFVTCSLGNGIALALHCFTQPGDHVITFNPVYHEFQIKIEKTGRVATQLPLAVVDGLFEMDFDAYDAMLTGKEKMVIISSPHNPAGRIWTKAELTALADFCQRHDLLLISDEIHNDLVMPGHTHIPMHVAAPQIEDRLIMMTSASKTFNIAGLRTGCVIIPDARLRAKFARYFDSMEIKPNLFGIALTRAAYSPAGAAWVDALIAYIDENQRVFNAAINEIPGVSAMPMQGTYLAWVDFADTGMPMSEVRERIYGQAQIGATWGPTLGPGGETCVRLNLGTNRARVLDAAQRIKEAFCDLQ